MTSSRSKKRKRAENDTTPTDHGFPADDDPIQKAFTILLNARPEDLGRYPYSSLYLVDQLREVTDHSEKDR